MMNSLIEESVIERSRAGDSGAFTEMVNILSPVAWRIAFRILASNEAAEDVAQESLVKLWRNLNRLGKRESFSSWFYRIVVNCCYDELRKRKRDVVSAMDESSWHILSEIIQGENGVDPSVDEYESILKAITDKLSPKQKVIFVLSELEGMERDEIVKITGMNGNTLKSNLYYARKRVMEIIKEDY